jgi:hypothetical protein
MLKSPPGRLYWSLVVVLALFGFLTGFSIGLPFLLLAAVLAVVSPNAGRPVLFWPPIVGLLVFVAGYVLTAPLGCTSTAVTPGGGVPYTTCTNLVGIHYSGRGLYNPPLLPALLAGVAAGVGAALLARLVIGRVSRARRLHVGRP